MSGTFAILQRFFTFNLWAALLATLGSTFLLAGLVVGGVKAGVILGSVGAFFLVGPLGWTGPAFRELMASRRLALVPGLRHDAVAALLLLALAVAVVTEALAIRIRGVAELSATAAPGLLAFGLGSAWLLLVQWISTFRVGVLVQVFALFGVMGAARWAPELLGVLLAGGRPAALAGVGALGWGWLFVAIGHGRRFRGPSASQQAVDIGEGTPSWQTGWLPAQTSFGHPVQAKRSLIQGGSDNLPNRVATALMWLLGVPAVYLLFGVFIGSLNREFDASQLDLFAVGSSLIGLATLSPMALADWPARMRCLWLRERGDRAALWRELERALIGEALLVAIVAAAIAAIVFAVFATAPGLLVVYVAACIVVMLFGGYIAFWSRVRGEDFVGLSMVLGFIWVFAALLGWLLYASLGLLGAAPLFAFFAGFTWFARRAARAQFLDMDWCAIRPLRRRPNGALAAEVR